MKKYLTVFVILYLFLQSVFSFSKREDCFSKTGFIKSYGNEPFCYPVFECENEKYSIKTDEKSKKELLSLQGKKIIVVGNLTENQEIELETFRIIK